MHGCMRLPKLGNDSLPYSTPSAHGPCNPSQNSGTPPRTGNEGKQRHMRKGSSCWDSLNRRIKASGRSCSRLGGQWGRWERAEAAGVASQAPSTSTHAHTEHLFTPMDTQGAFVVTNWGGTGGVRGGWCGGGLRGEGEEDIWLGWGWEKRRK